MTVPRRAAPPRRVPWGLALGLACAGCFGDWVSARTAPRPDAVPSAERAPAASAPAPPPPARACADYTRAVAQRCEATFDGYHQPNGCHGQIIRVQSVFRRDASERPQACTQLLSALPPAPARDRDPAPLGPACRRWAEQLRGLCVAPLSSTPPSLDRCAAAVLAFESILGGITFGQPEAYEDRCRAELDPVIDATAGGGGP